MVDKTLSVLRVNMLEDVENWPVVGVVMVRVSKAVVEI
jgi:hypothetical protein